MSLPPHQGKGSMLGLQGLPLRKYSGAPLLSIPFPCPSTPPRLTDFFSPFSLAKSWKPGPGWALSETNHREACLQ